jgi:AhpD family alkylhydroperoxidase
MAKYKDIYGNSLKMMQKLGKEIPGTMSAFTQLHKISGQTGALNRKEKELISLGIAIVTRCEPCISFHTHDAMKAGATREEIVEIIGIAICMGGGPALMYGLYALEAVDEYEKEGID